MKTSAELLKRIDDFKQNYLDWFGCSPSDEEVIAIMEQNLERITEKFIKECVAQWDGPDTIGTLNILREAHGAPETKETSVIGNTGRRPGRPKKSEQSDSVG